jgi:hypothetical protein
MLNNQLKINMINRKVLSSGANWTRLMQHAEEKEIGIITSFRSGKSLKENRKRNQQLANDIRSAGYGFVKVDGGYVQNFGEDTAQDVDEESYFVVGNDKNPNSLKELLSELGEKYNQDSVLYKPVDGDVILIGTNDADFPGYGNESIVSKTEEFYSKIKDRKFIFDNDNKDNKSRMEFPPEKKEEIDNEDDDLNEVLSFRKLSADDEGAIDMMGGDDDMGGDIEGGDDIGGDDMGGGMEGDMGGDMGGGMEGDMGGDMGGGEAQAPQIDYDKMFLEHTHDLEKVMEDDEDFEIDYSRLV